MTVNATRAFDTFVEDLSNWYIRRSRRRFWDGDEAAFRTLWYALAQSLRVIAPIMPFLSDHLWRTLTGSVEEAPGSIHLAGWPLASEPDEDLLAEVAELRRVVELGRQARSSLGVALRQPLRRLVVEGAPLAERHSSELAEELRVRDVEFGRVDASELRVKPHLPVLGPKLGKELGSVRSALAAGEFEELPGGGFRAAGHDLAPDEVLVERTGKEGWAVAASDGVTVALDAQLDDELRQLGRVYELIHRVNGMRKDSGLELTDRIRLTLPAADEDLLEHSEWIARETLATSVEANAVELAIEKS
jgi:isoleucyl-tRNA synthetase